MTLQAFFQLTGTLIATLFVALVVTGRFLVGSRVEAIATGWLVTYRRVVAVIGLVAGTVGESQVLKALLSSSPRSLVTPASAGLGILLATLVATLLSEAAEATRLSSLETALQRTVTLALISAAASLGGGYWIFYVRRP